MSYSDEVRIWWAAETQGPSGPFTQGEVFDAIRFGRLKAETLVRKGSNGEWSPLISVFPAAFSSTSVQATMPDASPSEGFNVPSRFGKVNRKVNVFSAVILSVITLSIYWFVWLYRRLGWYAHMSGHPLGKKVAYFWIAVGLIAASFLLVFLVFFVYVPDAILLVSALTLGSVVFLGALIGAVGRDQKTIVEDAGYSALPISPGIVVALYVVPSLLSLVLGFLPDIYSLLVFPIVLIAGVFFLIFFFQNHNAVIAASGERHDGLSAAN